MKVIIAGSRDGNFNILDVYKAVNRSQFKINEIISGTARGVDKLGELYAKINNINLIEFPANWDRYNKSAGIIRNKKMGDYADALIALWDGKSRGTKHMINYMRDLRKPFFIYSNEQEFCKNFFNNIL